MLVQSCLLKLSLRHLRGYSVSKAPVAPGLECIVVMCALCLSDFPTDTRTCVCTCVCVHVHECVCCRDDTMSRAI